MKGLILSQHGIAAKSISWPSISLFFFMAKYLKDIRGIMIKKSLIQGTG